MNSSRALNRFRILPVAFALIFNVLIGPTLPLSGAVTNAAAGPSVDNYSQCQIGNPSSGLDCESWINGILNATHNNYSEDEVVPQRLVMDFGTSGSHTITLRYMTRKDSSGQRHAYDYLATWNHTYVNADRCQDLNPASLCVGGAPTTFPIPSDPNGVSPGGPQPTSAHELPSADRQFVSYGGAVTGTSPITHAVDAAEAGSDYATMTLTVNVTTDGPFMLLFGGHLAAGFGPRGWGAGLGAASISGGPYHVILDAIDGEAIGSRDNQIMSNAIQPVPEPSLEITKTADAATVNAGAQIGFSVTVHNAGPGIATATTLSDPLPGGSGVNWSINPAYAGPGSCSITGTAPSQTLGCSFGDLAADASASVHVVSGTSFASCKAYANTATADADNFDPVTASASTTVLCPDLDLQKTPDGGVTQAGDAISFTLTLTNNGDGAATNVDIDDVLPAGFAWTESPDKTECSITSGALHCDIASLASGASFAVTVSAPTDAADCSTTAYTNHATADADNHAEVSNDGDVTIVCADVGVQKSGNGPLDAGDTAIFTIVVTASGNADSTNVTLTDDLPAGVVWALGAANDEAACDIDTSGDPDVLGCSFGTMAPDDSRTVVLSGTVDADECPSISNTAEIASDFDTDASNDSSTATITVNCGSVVLTKTPDAPGDTGGTVNAGGIATFTIGVENSGDGTAKGVQVSDQLPDVSGTWTTDNANCSVSGSNLLTCNLGDMAAHASIAIHVSTTVTTDDCGTLDNPLARATTTNDGTSEDSGAIEVTCPSLEITKTTDTPIVTAGGAVHYTVTVDNSAGDGTAEDVTVSDALPAGLTWTDDSDDCSISGSQLSCGPLDIAAGASFSVTLSGTTDPGDCPSISNSAAFASANAGSGSTESHPTVITVNCPDVSVEKSTTTPTVNADDQVSYTITVAAGGSGDSTSVTLSDTLPSGIDWSVEAPAGVTCDTSLNGVLTCDLGTMASGDSASIILTGTAGPEDCGTLENTATVSASVDVASGNNSAGPVAIDVNCPDVSVEKSGSGIVSAGDAIHYTIEASNTGEGDAYGFALIDTLPTVSGGWSLADDAPAFCTLDGNNLSCSLDPFEADDSFAVTLNATSTNADCGDLENTASVSATNEAESAKDNNESSHTITVNCPNLTIIKSADNGTISAGDLAAYTITVTNAGPGTATGVHLDEQLPAGVEWTVTIDDPAPAGGCVSSDGTDDPQSITCDFASMADGDSVTIHLSGETDAADCGTLHNVATVSGDNEDPQQLDDNSASADIVVECPGLNIAKSAVDDEIDGGDTASFEIVVWNTGPGEAHNVTVSDELPGGLSWTENSGDCSVAGNVLSCSFGDLGIGSFETSEARVTVSAETTRADCGELENLAVASADNNGDVDDDATITIDCPTVAIEKTNDQTQSVLPGTTVSYTLKVTVTGGTAQDVTVVDTLPDGLDAPTNISNGGSFDATGSTITWHLGDLAPSETTLTYQAGVSLDVANGSALRNVAVAFSSNSQCPDAENLGPECDDDSIVNTRVPTLVIDKAADREQVDVTAGEDTTVTWTLTYSLTDGPVTDAVISDPIPAGLSYVDGSASDAGTYDAGSRTLSWTFASLTAGGSVSFETTVDASVGGGVTIENVTTIDSDETVPDNGKDSIRTVEQEEQAATGTPQPSVPNTAFGSAGNGQPLNVPIELMVLVFLASLGGLALANVKAVRRRR